MAGGRLNKEVTLSLKTRADERALTNAIGRVRAGLEQISSESARATSRAVGATAAIGATGSRGAASGAMLLAQGAAWTMTTKSILDSGMALETYRAQLRTVMKTPEAAADMEKWIRDFEKGAPFALDKIMDATVRLTAYGLNAKKWMPLIGDLAGAMGKYITAALEAVADASTGELERLKEFGISGSQLVAAGAHKSQMGGGVASQTAEDKTALMAALERVMTERGGGGMKTLMSTGMGKVSNMETSVFNLKTEISDALLPSFKGLVDVVSWVTRTFGDVIGPVVTVGGAAWGAAIGINAVKETWRTLSDTFAAGVDTVKGFVTWLKVAQGASTTGDAAEIGSDAAQVGIMAWLMRAKRGAGGLAKGAGTMIAAGGAGSAALLGAIAAGTAYSVFRPVAGRDVYNTYFNTERGDLFAQAESARGQLVGSRQMVESWQRRYGHSPTRREVELFEAAGTVTDPTERRRAYQALDEIARNTRQGSAASAARQATYGAGWGR